MSFYKIDDLATTINGLSYSDMMAVSTEIARLYYKDAVLCVNGDHTFADLLTKWATEYKEKNAESK